MERTIKLIIIICFFLSQSTIAQILNPSFESRGVSYCDITKIVKTSSNTTVYFKYTAPSMYANGGWVCAGGDFFIRDSNTRKKYKLIKANNIPNLSPEKKFSIFI